MTTTENTYEIHESNFAELQSKIDKINRRAEKLGVEPLTLVTLDSFVDEHKGPDGEPIFYKKLTVAIEGGIVKLNGWHFAATIQHTTEGNIVRSVPNAGDEIDYLPYREVEPYCAHCKTIRHRIDTYLVANEEGEVKQVGSNCLKDFLGHDPRGALAMATYLSDLDDYIESEKSEGFGGGAIVYKIEDYLSWVAQEIRTHGWLSRGKARIEGDIATADAAEQARWNYYKNKLGVLPSDADLEMAEKALEWAREIPADVQSDYLYNLRVATSRDYITHREFGLVASAIAAYAREVEKKMVAEREKVVSEFQGEVGKRQEFVLTVERIIYSDGAYGVTFITKLVDEQGNIFTWFASNELEQGKTYTIKATVKKHEEYRGVKQTVITRGKVS
jgi:hypothetical protein